VWLVDARRARQHDVSGEFVRAALQGEEPSELAPPARSRRAAIGPVMGTSKSVVLESQKCAGKEGPMAVSAPSASAFAPSALMARTIALHGAVESALLHCTMKPFCLCH
jgi:hypothetical protein